MLGAVKPRASSFFVALLLRVLGLGTLLRMFPFNLGWKAWTALVPLILPASHASSQTKPITFHLKGLHSVAGSEPRIIFAEPGPSLLETSFTIPTRLTKVHRPHSHELLSRVRRGSGEDMVWVEDISIGPDLEDRLTLLNLAKMSYNAYLPHENKTTWYDLEHWTEVCQHNIHLVTRITRFP